MLEKKNPNDICIWKEVSECEDCSIKGRLQCHEDFRYSLLFGGTALLFWIPAFIGFFVGFIFGNLILPLFLIGFLGYVSYLVIFFVLWEPQMLCRHCPYYAEGETKILHCYANHGFYKTAKFTPAPMSKSEKAQFVIGVLIFAFYPIPFLIIGLVGLQYILFIIMGIGIISWFLALRFKICKDCVNFSCPFNQVEKKVVDEFLKRNPIMREAWEKSGYKID